MGVEALKLGKLVFAEMLHEQYPSPLNGQAMRVDPFHVLPDATRLLIRHIQEAGGVVHTSNSIMLEVIFNTPPR